MAVEVEESKRELKGSKLPSLWHNRDFMLLWSGQMVSGLGSNMTNLAMPLLILAITNSPQMAGIASACSYIPYVLFSLPVGALMDRWDRKQVMIICDIVRTINIASIPLAATYGALTIGQILVNTFVEGSAYVFFSISETAALPQVVDRRQLPAASAQNNAGFGLMELIGAPLAGFLYNTVGRLVPFIFDAVSYSASVVSLAFIRTRFQSERAKAERHLRVEIAEGMRWLWRRPIIRLLAILAAGVNLRLTATYLIVIVLAQKMSANAFQLGLVFSVAAGAGIVGSLIGGIIQRRFSFVQVITATRVLTTLIFPLLPFRQQHLAAGAGHGCAVHLRPHLRRGAVQLSAGAHPRPPARAGQQFVPPDRLGDAPALCGSDWHPVGTRRAEHHHPGVRHHWPVLHPAGVQPSGAPCAAVGLGRGGLK